MPTVEKPKYGGVLNVLGADPTSWDPWTVLAIGPLNIGHEHLMMGDWATPREKWAFDGLYLPVEFRIPHLAESWEQPDNQTVIFHLRKGIKFNAGLPAARALVQDRELVADDVVYTFSRSVGLNKGKWGLTGQPSTVELSVLQYLESVTALDKYTVKFRFREPHVLMLWSLSCYHSTMIIPHEVVEKYGNYNDWRNYVGTGPLIITDYVPSSAITCERNPQYWATSITYGKDYKLPFLDGVRMLIISDASTQVAALRTGKLDILNVGWEQIDSLAKTNPELHMSETFRVAYSLIFRSDLKPFNDMRVRQAMVLAINHQALAKDVFGGHAAINTSFSPNWYGYYTPVDQLPTEPRVPGSTVSVKQLYSYSPDNLTKAKALLAEAGYPTGFKTEVVALGSYTTLCEELQSVKEMWAKIGVDVQVKVMESAAYLGLVYAHKYPQMASQGSGQASPEYMLGWMARDDPKFFNVYNVSEIYDTVYNAKYKELMSTFDPDKRKKLAREMTYYLQEQGYSSCLPTPYTYTYWQPWVKGGYWGQFGMLYGGTGDLWRNIWLDQDLKESITGKR
jgi:peptide/nickel transport system substrate-binding protein